MRRHHGDSRRDAGRAGAPRSGGPRRRRGVIAALVIGTLLAVGALAFVLYPVFFGVVASARRVAALTPRHAPRANRRSPRCARSSSIARRASCRTPTTRSSRRGTRSEAVARCVATTRGRGSRAPRRRRDRGGGARVSREPRVVSRRAGHVPSPTRCIARIADGTYATGAPVAAHLSTR